MLVSALQQWQFAQRVGAAALVPANCSMFTQSSAQVALQVGAPPADFLSRCKLAHRSFVATGAPASAFAPEATPVDTNGTPCRHRLMAPAEYAARHSKPPELGRQYFKHLGDAAPATVPLDDICLRLPLPDGLSMEECGEERVRRHGFLDFLRGVLAVDPAQRWTPWQALQHPFLTGLPYTGPFTPPVEPCELRPAARTPRRSTVSTGGAANGGGEFGTSPSAASLLGASPAGHGGAGALAGGASGYSGMAGDSGALGGGGGSNLFGMSLSNGGGVHNGVHNGNGGVQMPMPAYAPAPEHSGSFANSGTIGVGASFSGGGVGGGGARRRRDNNGGAAAAPAALFPQLASSITQHNHFGAQVSCRPDVCVLRCRTWTAAGVCLSHSLLHACPAILPR